MQLGIPCIPPQDWTAASRHGWHVGTHRTSGRGLTTGFKAGERVGRGQGLEALIYIAGASIFVPVAPFSDLWTFRAFSSRVHDNISVATLH